MAPKTERNERIRAAYAAGATMQAIAASVGISTERVRQIVRHHNPHATGRPRGRPPVPVDVGIAGLRELATALGRTPGVVDIDIAHRRHPERIPSSDWFRIRCGSLRTAQELAGCVPTRRGRPGKKQQP